jgi:hypothetical protein
VLPEAFQGYRWKLCYSIGANGSSFATFYNKCRRKTPTILCLRTMDGDVSAA